MITVIYTGHLPQIPANQLALGESVLLLSSQEPIPARGTTPGTMAPPFLEAAWPPHQLRRAAACPPAHGTTSDYSPPGPGCTPRPSSPQQNSPACTLHHYYNPLPTTPETLAQPTMPVLAKALALPGAAEVLARAIELTRAMLRRPVAAHTDVLAHPVTATLPVLSCLEAAAMLQLAGPSAVSQSATCSQRNTLRQDEGLGCATVRPPATGPISPPQTQLCEGPWGGLLQCRQWDSSSPLTCTSLCTS
ncbi:UNVERIFIED_CONTAM: hypothetical protein K2H54_034453 [Gekko kuhli]